MPDLQRTRKKLKIALAVMAAVDVLAVAVYVSPLVGSAETRRQEMTQLQAELAVKTRQVAPLKDLDKKIKLAAQQIGDFYKKRFPSEDSQILAELGKLTAADGVTIEQVRYKILEEGPGRLRPVEMEAGLAGNYTALARFINALERDDMFFIIDSVTLGGEQQGPVKLSVRLETYLKAES